ncbi:MAG TPA: prepilin-type cleavage/methylation domain-containing protein, partial [Cyanobacteria bacterium UBA11149]|nr:prepilin-type cleavage/methylation domain-containing protein [Cyanobacteria bacterium UBA11149]
MKLNFQINQKLIHTSTAGYTLIEIIIIVAIIGILSAIIAPSWLSFIERQRLNTAQDQIYRAMQEAKSNALRDKITWQVSFRKVIVNGKQ